MLILTTYRHVYTLDCNPKMEWIVPKFGKSERTTYRTIRSLEDKGYLVSVRRGFDRASNFYFAHDFKSAFLAYHCPGFKGDRTSLLKANRKRWARIDAINARNGKSSSATLDGKSIYKNDRIKRIENGGTYECPHCGQAG